MASSLSYRFAEKAVADLNGILDYMTVTLCNPKAAEDFYNEVFKVIDNICTFPDVGAAVDNEYIHETGIRRIGVDNYEMFYKRSENDTVVYIVRIIYGRRNIAESFWL